MPEYLENPRRVPRVPFRCRARVFVAGGAVDTTTEDIGSRGCRVVLSVRVQRGDVVGLALSAAQYDQVLRVDGRVAWVSPAPPWRVGIAYAAQVLPEAARWFQGLRQAVPELFAGRHPQERVPVDAMVFLGPVPALPDFREDERVVLRAVGAGIRVGDLRTALSRTWPRMHRALFTLLAQGHVILSRAAATHPVRWKDVLGEPPRTGNDSGAGQGGDDAFVLDDAPPATPPPAPADAVPSSRITAKVPAVGSPRVSRRMSEGIEPVDAGSAVPAPTRTPAPLRTTSPAIEPAAPPLAARPAADPPGAPPVARTPPPIPRANTRLGVPAVRAEAATPGGLSSQPAPKPDFVGAGVGWRAPAHARPAEADELLKLGMAEIEARRPHGALALLRRALSLAPGDPEIAAAIGRAMRRDGA